MADIKWIKLDTGIFEDEKIKIVLSMPEGKALLVIWLKILCLAGRINNSGVLMINKTIPYTLEMLSSVFGETEKMMRLAIETFQQLGMVEQFNGTLLLPNWEKHQSEDRLKEIQLKSAIRVAKHRERQRIVAECNVTETLHVTLPKRICNADVTPQNKNSELRTQNSDVPTTESFDVFWEAYPKKKAKAEAKKVWLRIKPSKELLNTILKAISAQKETSQWQKEGGQFIPYPASWLNKGCWDDEVETQPQQQHQEVRDSEWNLA